MLTIALDDLGTIDYGRCWELQREVFAYVAAGEEDGRLILCEHPHVYTLGRSGDAANLLINEEFLTRIGASYYQTDRGGDITYHGPGQMVGYPILDLAKLGIGIRHYIHALEQAVIDTLSYLGIAAGRREGAAGVWLTEPMRKIAAIGVRASRGITMHGFALNVSTDLSYFSHINPCGFTDGGVTSVERELGRTVEIDRVKAIYVRHFEKYINIKIK